MTLYVAPVLLVGLAAYWQPIPTVPLGKTLAFEGRVKVNEQENRQGPLGSGSPLQSERGTTSIADGVVQKIVGIAALEVEGIQMGGSTARAVGNFLDSVTSGGGITRGVSVEVGEVETAIDLTMAVEYGRPILQTTESVRDKLINRVENLTSLRVEDGIVTANLS